MVLAGVVLKVILNTGKLGDYGKCPRGPRHGGSRPHSYEAIHQAASSQEVHTFQAAEGPTGAHALPRQAWVHGMSSLWLCLACEWGMRGQTLKKVIWSLYY
jgi:hypothetical protein